MIARWRSPQLLFLFFTLFLSPIPFARAAEEFPVPRGISREPVPFQYTPKLLTEVPKDFLDDSVACMLYSGNTYLVEADGTIETITHELTRLNGRKAIEKLGEYRNISYDPSYQKLTLNVARIHKANGRVVEVLRGIPVCAT